MNTQVAVLAVGQIDMAAESIGQAHGVVADAGDASGKGNIIEFDIFWDAASMNNSFIGIPGPEGAPV